jgi:cytochrome P450
VNVILDRLIATAKADPNLEERPDILASLVQATHTDGTPMENAEIRDQLVTMLAAGHETTAHQLSWAVERLARNPEPLARLVAEIDHGEGKAYRDATIREVQRVRPVIFFAGRVTMREYELGGYTLPRGVLIAQAAALTHFDPELFDQPHRFMPERFVDKLPDTYAWIPFGGGVRRCIGATFAHMEMDVVLRTLLERFTIEPTTAPDERWKFRGVATAPRNGGRVVFRRR